MTPPPPKKGGASVAILLLVPVTALACSPTLFSNVFVTPKLITIALGLCFLAQERLPELKASNMAWTFLGAAVVSVAFSLDITVSGMGQYRCPYHGLIAMSMTLLAFIGGAAVDSRELRQTVAYTAAGLSLMAVFQRLVGSAHIGGIALAFGDRAGATIGSPVFLGAYLAVGAVCALSLLCEEGEEALLSVSAIVVGLVACWAKGGALAAICGGALYLLSKRRVASWFVASSVVLLFVYIAHSSSVNAMERVELWRISGHAFLEHPWLGWGPDNFLLAFRRHRTFEYIAILGKSGMGQASAHEDLCQVAVTMGLLGLAAYLAMLRAVFVGLRSDWSRAVFFAVLIQAQLQPIPIEVQVVAALLLGADSLWEPWSFEPSMVRIVPFLLAATIAGLAAADFHARRGSLNDLRAAASYSRATEHGSTLIRALFDRAAKAPRGAQDLMLADAEAVAHKAVREHPADPIVWDDYADALAVQGRPYAAYAAMGHAVALDPTMAYLRARHAQAGLTVGDKSGAYYSLAMLAKIKQAEGGRP